MKLCEKCSAPNEDQRAFCVDCGEKLGKRLSRQEAEAYELAIRKKTEKLYNSEDPLYIGLFDKIVGVLSLAGLIASLMVLVGGLAKNGYVWGALPSFFVAVLDSFVPKLMWELTEWRRGYYTGDTAPAGLDKFFRRFGELVAFGMGVVFVLKGLG